MIDRLHRLPAGARAALLSAGAIGARAADDELKRELGGAIDWPALAADADAHVVGVLVHRRLCELELAEALPPDIRRRWLADTLHAKLQYVLQRRECVRVSRALSDLGIRHAVFKGAAYRLWLYAPAWVRVCGDIDILVRPGDVEAVRRAMRDLGFVQASCSPDYQCFQPASRDEIAHSESRHYELAQFIRDHRLVNAPDWLLDADFVQRIPFGYEELGDGPVLHINIDVHWALHFAFADASLVDDAKPFAIRDGIALPVPGSAWNLLTSCFKLYFEAFDRPGYGLHHLVDIVALIDGGMDWPLFGDLVEQYRIDAAAFYVLSAAECLAGRALVPEGVRDGWQTTRPMASAAAAHSNDYGDFVPFMLGTRVSVGW